MDAGHKSDSPTAQDYEFLIEPQMPQTLGTLVRTLVRTLLRVLLVGASKGMLVGLVCATGFLLIARGGYIPPYPTYFIIAIGMATEFVVLFGRPKALRYRSDAHPQSFWIGYRFHATWGFILPLILNAYIVFVRFDSRNAMSLVGIIVVSMAVGAVFGFLMQGLTKIAQSLGTTLNPAPDSETSDSEQVRSAGRIVLLKGVLTSIPVIGLGVSYVAMSLYSLFLRSGIFKLIGLPEYRLSDALFQVWVPLPLYNLLDKPESWTLAAPLIVAIATGIVLFDTERISKT